MRLHIIVNEFGKASVDGPLLESLNASLKQINNGSIFCTCKLDAFEEELSSVIAQEPDCIIVEASGLSDPTNIRAIINAPQYRDQLDYSGTICIADAMRFHKVYATTRCIKKQLAASDLVILNKVDVAKKDIINQAVTLISNQRPDIKIHQTSHGKVNINWLADLNFSSYNDSMYTSHIPDISLQKLIVEVSPAATQSQLLYFLRSIAEDTYRIKGFVTLGKEDYLVNCVGTMIDIQPYALSGSECVGHLVILSGQGLPIIRSIKNAQNMYTALFALQKKSHD